MTGSSAGTRLRAAVGELYRSAINGRPVRRRELAPGNPFYAHLDGGGRYQEVTR